MTDPEEERQSGDLRKDQAEPRIQEEAKREATPPPQPHFATNPHYNANPGFDQAMGQGMHNMANMTDDQLRDHINMLKNNKEMARQAFANRPGGGPMDDA